MAELIDADLEYLWYKGQTDAITLDMIERQLNRGDVNWTWRLATILLNRLRAIEEKEQQAARQEAVAAACREYFDESAEGYRLAKQRKPEPMPSVDTFMVNLRAQIDRFSALSSGGPYQINLPIELNSCRDAVAEWEACDR